jgi:uncharacterized protein (TIGR02246 family)
MRRAILPLVVLVAAACQPGAVPLSDDDVAAIRSLGTSYAEASVAGDAEGMAAVYTHDAIEMPPNRPVTVGKDAIRAGYVAGLETGATSTEFTVTSVEIDGVDGLAFDRGTWTWSGTAPGTTATLTDTGQYISIVRQQEDGSWLWSATIWNSDTPLPQP